MHDDDFELPPVASRSHKATDGVASSGAASIKPTETRTAFRKPTEDCDDQVASRSRAAAKRLSSKGVKGGVSKAKQVAFR